MHGQVLNVVLSVASLDTTSNYLKLTLSNITSLSAIAFRVPVLKDCMNFGRLLNVAAKPVLNDVNQTNYRQDKSMALGY